MNESIHSYMKLGTIAFMSYPEIMKGEGDKIEPSIKKILDDTYFTAIEITWIKDPVVRGRVAKLLEQSLVTTCYGAQPRFLTTGMNINDCNEQKRQAALASLLEGVDEAYSLGAKGIAFLSGKYDETTKEQSYQALLKSTREVCAYAVGKGNMMVELEIFDYDIDKKSLIGPTAYARQFAEDIRKDFNNFGLIVDLSHIPLIRETIADSIIPIKDLITHVHIGNAVTTPGAPAYGDAHPRFGFPGSANGMDELVEFLRTLLNIGFLNKNNPPVLSFEIKPFGNEDPDTILAGCKRFLDEAWLKV
jgi:sugar phosphate isomerase/epimerase